MWLIPRSKTVHKYIGPATTQGILWGVLLLRRGTSDVMQFTPDANNLQPQRWHWSGEVTLLGWDLDDPSVYQALARFLGRLQETSSYKLSEVISQDGKRESLLAQAGMDRGVVLTIGSPQSLVCKGDKVAHVVVDALRNSEHSMAQLVSQVLSNALFPQSIAPWMACKIAKEPLKYSGLIDFNQIDEIIREYMEKGPE